ncbi:MAG: YegS/Rv2252/BmrU family lipid kinase [Bacteroidaceae bacterium]|nr:YegS/Rv2252/BmrU family lipid kinase [Bacteroidaceae bacterium]
MDSEKKHITFIVNPISGTQEKEQIIALINEYLDIDKYTFQIIYTQYAGHAEEIAAQCAEENHFAVVAVGGDGTVNEVARALTHTHTALGIIPCGSGNGLARHLQISMQPRKAIEAINEGLIERIDYGTINRRKFFCTCGVGFDAFVSLKFAEAGKRGLNTYIEQSLNASLNYKPETYKLTIDGNETEIYQAFLIACGNAAQYGNNAYIAPKATLTDGLLDVTILNPFTPLDVPSLALQLFTKTIDQNSHIKTFRCKTINIRREKPGVVHYDGDPVMMGANLKVKIHHAGLHVIVPTDDNKDFNVLDRAQEVINGIRQMNEQFFEGIRQRNNELLDKGKKQLKKLTKL